MISQAFSTNIYNLWLQWLEFTHYSFFEAWGTFWLMLSHYYMKWIQENPIEFQSITDSFINKYGKTATYEIHEVQEIVLLSICTSKYVGKEIWYSLPQDSDIFDPSEKRSDEISDALTLFKHVSNGMYQSFVNGFQYRYNKGIFDDISRTC